MQPMTDDTEFAVFYRRPYWNDERDDSLFRCHTRRQAETTAERYRDEGCSVWVVKRHVTEWEDA